MNLKITLNPREIKQIRVNLSQKITLNSRESQKNALDSRESRFHARITWISIRAGSSLFHVNPARAYALIFLIRVVEMEHNQATHEDEMIQSRKISVILRIYVILVWF